MIDIKMRRKMLKDVYKAKEITVDGALIFTYCKFKEQIISSVDMVTILKFDNGVFLNVPKYAKISRALKSMGIVYKIETVDSPVYLWIVRG